MLWPSTSTLDWCTKHRCFIWFLWGFFWEKSGSYFVNLRTIQQGKCQGSGTPRNGEHLSGSLLIWQTVFCLVFVNTHSTPKVSQQDPLLHSKSPQSQPSPPESSPQGSAEAEGQVLPGTRYLSADNYQYRSMHTPLTSSKTATFVPTTSPHTQDILQCKTGVTIGFMSVTLN